MNIAIWSKWNNRTRKVEKHLKNNNNNNNNNKKTVEGQEKKEDEALEVLNSVAQKLTIEDAIPENRLSEEARNELNKIKEMKKLVDREN